ncbi:MAG: hypothetical protein ACXWUR_05820, partial [Allosphingosinicella sp.]
MIERSIGYVSIAAAVLLLGLSGCASPGDDGSSAHYPPHAALFFQNAEIVAARAARGSVSPYLVDFGGTPPVAEIGDHRFYDWRAAVNLASARDRR